MANFGYFIDVTATAEIIESLIFFGAMYYFFPKFTVFLGIAVIFFIIWCVKKSADRKAKAEAQQKAYEEWIKPENIRDEWKRIIINEKAKIEIGSRGASDEKYLNNAVYVAAKYGFTIVNPEYYERTETLRALMRERGETQELDFNQIIAERAKENKSE